MIHRVRVCSCGSGLMSDWMHDARGIPVSRVCDKCRDEKMSRYRPDIFTDPNYAADEPIDDD